MCRHVITCKTTTFTNAKITTCQNLVQSDKSLAFPLLLPMVPWSVRDEQSRRELHRWKVGTLGLSAGLREIFSQGVRRPIPGPVASGVPVETCIACLYNKQWAFTSSIWLRYRKIQRTCFHPPGRDLVWIQHFYRSQDTNIVFTVTATCTPGNLRVGSSHG